MEQNFKIKDSHILKNNHNFEPSPNIYIKKRMIFLQESPEAHNQNRMGLTRIPEHGEILTAKVQTISSVSMSDYKDREEAFSNPCPYAGEKAGK